jgi:hypothetical protein
VNIAHDFYQRPEYRNSIMGQKYSVFGLFPSSGILGARKHDVSETGSVSVLRCAGKTPAQLGLLERDIVGVLPPHLRTKTDPVPETSCFLVSRIPDDGKVQKPSNSECDTPSSEPFRIYFYYGCRRETGKDTFSGKS